MSTAKCPGKVSVSTRIATTTVTQDVHAGNLLVLEDGRVAFIDFGIVGRFSPDTWTGVSRLADGIAEENFTVMAEVRIRNIFRVAPGFDLPPSVLDSARLGVELSFR